MGWQAAHVEREKMNAARRAAQKANRAGGGGHTVLDHPVSTHTVIDGKGRHHEVRDSCTVCRPLPQTETQRAARRAQRAAEARSAASRSSGTGLFPDMRQLIEQALHSKHMAAMAQGGFGRRASHVTRGYRKVAK
jgi:hypothetical protein